MSMQYTGFIGTGKRMTAIEYIKRNAGVTIYSNYPGIGTPLEFPGVLPKNYGRLDYRIEKLLKEGK